MKIDFSPFAKSVTTPIDDHCRSEVRIRRPPAVIVFYVGGAGDKFPYYLSGPNLNIYQAMLVMRARIYDLYMQKLYEPIYLGYNEICSEDDIANNVIPRIPDKQNSVYIIGHSLGGWNSAHLSSILSNMGYNVEMLITLDPVGKGACVWIASDIHRSQPTPKAKFWINILARPLVGDDSDTIADFGEQWIVESGPDLNYIMQVNHYNARKMFVSPLKNGRSAADSLYHSIRKKLIYR